MRAAFPSFRCGWIRPATSKRFSSGRFLFSRFGGTCPLWNLHSTFRTPGHAATQIVELPDSSRWFSIARTVKRAFNPWARSIRNVVGLGCELKYAHRFVYARVSIPASADATPIGINCRLCERAACPQRAAPPHGGRPDRRRDEGRCHAFEFDAT